MKQFGKIFRFEFDNYLKNKVFVGITIFIIVVMAGVLFFPRVKVLIKNGDSTPDKPENRPVMLIKADDASQSAVAEEIFSSSFSGYEVKLTDDSTEQVKEKIISGEAECAFVMTTPTSFVYYVNNLTMYDANSGVAAEVLQRIYQMSAMINSGMTAEQAGAVMNIRISGETVSLGKDQVQNFFYTYIMIFALYMVLLLYGQMIATNVANEKSSRAMELLITSAKPAAMMFGKVIASCLAGLLQLILIFGSALLLFNVNKSYWGDNMIIESIFNIPPELRVYMLVFFILGFLIYAFLYGAAGSTVSKLEDANTAVMPITMLFLVSFFVAMFSMTSGNVDNTLIKVCSFIPFTSPMSMFTRIAMSTVPAYEIAISIAILIASTVGVGVLTAKIYRVGVLLYGTSPKLGNIIKAVRKS